MRIPASITGLCMMLCWGCSGGGSSDGQANLERRISLALADYAIIDLHAGTVEGRASVDLTDTRYKGRWLVLRRLESGSVAGGGDQAHPWTLADEPAGTREANGAFVGIYEITRAQWTSLTNTTPWSAFDSDLVGTGDDLPAVGISRQQVSATLQALSTRVGGNVTLPGSGEWEYWCRAGNSGLFSWGDATDQATTTLHAVTVDSTPEQRGPRPVGSLRANAFGLFDMHGNAWEMTSEDLIRGGSWRDGLPMARAANLMPLDPTTGHPLVGMRLVFRPW